MKWENRPRSQNVELDCLGKRTKFDDSPEAQAALACQAALDELQTDKVNQLAVGTAGQAPALQSISGLDATYRRAVAERHVEREFNADVSSFMELMGDDSKKGLVRKFVDHLFGADTYKGRLEMFKSYLDVPPLPELQPRPPQRAGVRPADQRPGETSASDSARPGRAGAESGKPGNAPSGNNRDISQGDQPRQH